MENEKTTLKKWWGWGEKYKTFSLEDKPNFWKYLKRKFGQPIFTPVNPPDFAELVIPSSQLKKKHLTDLMQLIDSSRISTSAFVRFTRSIGKSYRDLITIRNKNIPSATDAVVFPQSADEILKILQFAAEHEIGVIPFGGGSSVVGGVEAIPLAQHKKSEYITIDMSYMNRVKLVDPISQLAVIEAGVFGPSLEKSLGKVGYALGHSPQSFEFSTLGGWIAARSAGQQSTLYGKIEDMVNGLQIITPNGIYNTSTVPASATGPEFREIFIGSEGTYGVISEASMKICRRAESKKYNGLLFKDFTKGVTAIRTIMQEGIKPAAIRLSDPEETAFASKLRPESFSVKEFVQRGAIWSLDKMGYSFERGSLMILGFEGSNQQIEYEEKRALEICKDFGGLNLGKSVGNHWYKDRFEHPYLRDTLLDYAVMIETLETSTTWNKIHTLYNAVRQAIHNAMNSLGETGIVMCHLSRSYREGTSLYFIFLSRQKRGDELLQWQTIKKTASDAIIAHGGTISHHHGVGWDHAPWFVAEHGRVAVELCHNMKKVLDPKGIMNPGKVFGFPVE